MIFSAFEEQNHEQIVRRLEQDHLQRITGRVATPEGSSSRSREQMVEDERILLEESFEADSSEPTVNPTLGEEELQNNTATLLRAEEECQRLIDSQKETNARQNDLLETFVFVLEIISSLITVFHFLYIWSLHGFTFGLIDWALALLLYTAASTAGRKVSRN